MREDRIKRYFGENTYRPYQTLRCKICDVEVNLTAIKEHAQRVHNKKVLRRCKLCPYTSTHLYQWNTKKHMEDVHGIIIGPDNVDTSELDINKPILDALTRQLFYD